MYSSPSSTPADLHSFLTPTDQGVLNPLCGGLLKATSPTPDVQSASVSPHSMTSLVYASGHSQHTSTKTT